MDGCGSKLLAVLILVLCCCGPAMAIKCYAPTPDGAGVIAIEFNDPTTLCLRYQFVCTKGNSACTAKDVGKLKWDYTTTTSSACSDIKKSTSVYKNVLCCNSNLCNAPSAKLDSATKVIPGEVKLGEKPAGPTKKP